MLSSSKVLLLLSEKSAGFPFLAPVRYTAITKKQKRPSRKANHLTNNQFDE